jgi:hypothetical protein
MQWQDEQMCHTSQITGLHIHTHTHEKTEFGQVVHESIFETGISYIQKKTLNQFGIVAAMTKLRMHPGV